MATRNSSKGFSPVEIAIAILIAAVLVLGGWYVWQSNRDPTPNSDTSNGSQQPGKNKIPEQDQTAEGRTESWVSYSSAEGQFSFKYPPSWMLPTNMEQCSKDTEERSGIMVGPNEESAGKCGSGNTGQVAIGSYVGDQRNTTEDGATIAEAKIQGVEGVKRTRVDTGEEGFHPRGTKFVIYEFYANGRTYRATYRQWPTETDQLAIFETIVKETLKFGAE